MIDLSFTGTGDAGLSSTCLDLRTEVESIVDARAAAAGARGLHLRMQSDAPVVRACVDRTCLRAILHALIDHALSATERGHVTVYIRLRERHVAVSVVDTGVRFSASRRAHVARVRHEVECLDGRLRVEHRAGEGTTVTLVFPRPRRATTVAPHGRSAPRMRATRPSRHPRILIVDPGSNGQASQRPMALSCDVATVGDIEAARQLCGRIPLDVVLLNIDGQEAGGLELMESLREAAGSRRLFIVAVTARPDPAEQGVLLDAGFDAYAPPPFAAQLFAWTRDRARPS